MAASDCNVLCAYYCFDVLVNHFNKAQKIIAPTFEDNSFPLFVTWDIERRQCAKELRGCIGNFNAMSLHSGLRDYALISALQDRRFSPMTSEEVPYLHCGVSLLVNFEDATDYLDWTVGLHGIWIEFVSDSGHTKTATYLPQIAQEQGWDKVQAIDSLLRKGGFRSNITEHTRKAIKLTRYQSSKCEVTYAQYKQWRQSTTV